MKKLILILTIVFAFTAAKSQVAQGQRDPQPAASTTVTASSATVQSNAVSKEKSKKSKKKSKKCSSECQTKCAEGASAGKSCCEGMSHSKAAVVSPSGTEAKPVEEKLEPTAPK